MWRWPWSGTRTQPGFVAPAPHVPLDYTEHWPLTSEMLRQPDLWRVRAVERLTVGSARLCGRHRSLHAGPLAAVFSAAGVEQPDAGARVRMLVPVELIDKRPLLDFNVEVDGAPAYLVTRVATSDLQAGQICDLLEDEGVEPGGEAVFDLIASICEFTSSAWKNRRRRPRLTYETLLRQYVVQGLDRDLTDTDYQLLLKETRALADVLATARDEPQPWWSSSTEPILALIGFAVRQGNSDLQAMATAVRELTAALRSAVPLDADAGSQAIRMLARYGSSWQAFVVAEVPVDKPFVVVTERQEPLKMRRTSRVVRQRLVLADADTNHVTVGTSDESVELKDAKLRAHDGDPLGVATGVRKSRERYAVYLSEPFRPARGSVGFVLKVPASIWLVSLLIGSVTWAAVGIEMWLLWNGRLRADDLAVLTVPTTFAASLLLTRERNSLARRLQWKSRTAVWLGTACLWVVALYAWATCSISNA